VIGVVTETLARISSPRNVQVNPVLGAVQSQVTALQGQGVNKIVLLTQLQDIDNDLALASQINGVDVIVSGGGQETQLDDQSQAIPGDVRTPGLVFPEFRTAPNGNPVAVVTTNGLYRYVGRLECSSMRTASCSSPRPTAARSA
jgi:5'-nucleotidase